MSLLCRLSSFFFLQIAINYRERYLLLYARVFISSEEMSILSLLSMKPIDNYSVLFSHNLHTVIVISMISKILHNLIKSGILVFLVYDNRISLRLLIFFYQFLLYCLFDTIFKTYVSTLHTDACTESFHLLKIILKE